MHWPTNTSVLYAGANYSVPCNQPELVPVPIPQICESPLEANNVGGCSFSCPLPSLSDSQYDNVKTMQGVLGWFSWVRGFFISYFRKLTPIIIQSATAALILFLVLCPRARAFPRNMIIMTACAANIAVISFFQLCVYSLNFLPSFSRQQQSSCQHMPVMITFGAEEARRCTRLQLDLELMMKAFL